MEQKFAEFLIDRKIINDNEKEVYIYGLKKLKLFVFNVVLTAVIGAALGMLGESILFLALFIPVRQYAGGYHAPGPRSCLAASVLLTIIILLAMKYIYAGMLAIVITVVISAAVIFLRAPVESRNKPLTDKERKVFRYRARGVVFIETIAALVLLVLSLEYVSKCITFVIACCALLTLFSDSVGRMKTRSAGE